MPDRRERLEGPDWRQRVEDLLYAGEEVLLRVGRESDEIIVTSHRLLAFTPEGEGSNFHAVDLPNVEAVRLDTTGRWGLVRVGARILLGGILVLATGALVDFDGLAESIPATGTDAVGTGSVLRLLDGVRSLLAMTDELLLALGGLSTVVGAGVLLVYWVSRRQQVVVEVAGGENVHLDGDSFRESDLSKIATALERR